MISEKVQRMVRKLVLTVFNSMELMDTSLILFSEIQLISELMNMVVQLRTRLDSVLKY